MTRTSRRGFRPGFDGLEGRQLLSVTLPETSNAAPAIVAFQNSPYIAWTGTDNHLNIENLDTGVKRTLPDTSSAAPALAVYRGRLFIAWTGTDLPQHHLNVESSTDGMTFGNKDVLGQTTNYWNGPSLAPYNNALAIAWTGTDQRLNYALTFDTLGRFFSQAHTLSISSFVSPSLYSAFGDLFLAWNDARDNVNTYDITTQYSHSLGSPSYFPVSVATDEGFPGSPWVGHASTDRATGVVYVTSEPIDQVSVGTSPFGPSLATDPNPDGHHFYVAWTGMDHHLYYDVV
jgi:hypothetical protein